jgi:hypothetical protein
MRYTQNFILALGVLMLSVGGHVASGQGAARHCTTEECACEEALKKNTVKALEDFLRKYPHSETDGASACSAIGVPPGDGNSSADAPGHDGNGPQKGPALPPSEG